MHNQVAVEAIHSAAYVKNYLDSVENLPDDVQRHLSRIREIDVQYRGHLRDVDYYYDQWSNCSTNDLESVHATKRTRAMARIQQSLIAAQELGDEKLQIVTQMQELIDHKTRQLEHDFKNLDYGKDEPMLELQTKEQLPAAATHSISNINSPSLASPVIVASAAPSFSTVTAIPTPAAITTSAVASSSSAAATERFTASNSSNNNASAANAATERASKRPRRARNDNNGAGNGIDTSATIDASVTPEPAHKQIATTTVAPATSSTNAAGQKKSTTTSATTSTTTGSVVGVASSSTGSTGRKAKKRKSGRAQAATSSSNQQSAGAAVAAASREPNRDDTPPAEETIDPDEPTYCLCDQISFGEMILCDNDLCPIEWFHFSCVSLLSKPKGKWFCPNCRGDRPNIMKPKAQFLKELERYNKEKEEKT